MDHLPSPKDGIPPNIIVPILGKTASRTAIYDGGDYMSFPERRGFRTRAEIDDDNRMLDVEALSQHSYLSVLAFIQAWLYFGLLHSAFAILGVEFDESSFIRHTEDGDNLSTSNFQTLLRRPATAFSAIDWIIGRHIVRAPDNPRLRHFCHHALAQVQDLENLWFRPERIEAPFPEIMLSIRVLASTFLVWNHDPSNQSWNTVDSFGALSPSMLPIYNHLLKTKGWCPHQALHLCTHFSPVTLYYLASMKRRRKADHSQCAQSERCVASNVNKGFVAKHVAPCTGVDCPPVVALNQHRLLENVMNGDIPVVIASKSAEGIELRYAPANPHYGYIAPSHVWSDGLGDPNHNHLPRCQLTQLLERLYEAEKSVAYSNARLAGRGTQATIRRFNERYPKLLERPLVFWLDAYCIPAFSTDEEVRRLKMSAIMRMVPTYGLAQQVLVLDSELPKLSKQATGLDLMAALMICTWRSRYWTHQELTLAGTKSIVVQYRKPVLLQRLLKTASIGGDPYGDESIHDLTSKAKEDGSLTRALAGRISDELASVLEEGKVGATQVQSRRIHMGKVVRKALGWMQRLISWQSPGAIVAEDVFFLKMWCSFLGKTSSLPEDMHGILANLLNLDTDEVIKLEPEQRVRSILASYGRLPMNLLLSTPPLSPSENENSRTSAGPAEDRWIPMLPDGRDILSTPLAAGLYFNVSADGLICSPSVSHCIVRIQQPPANVWRANGWYVGVECAQSKLKRQMCFQVILLCEDDGSTNPWRSDEMLLFLPTLHALTGGGAERPEDPTFWQRGACFRKLSQDTRYVWCNWICAVKYRQVNQNSLASLEDGVSVRYCNGSIMLDTADTNGRRLGIACSTDPSTWPRVPVKRRPGILSGKINPWLAGVNVIFLFGWPIMLLVGIGISTSHPPLVAPILITAACIFLVFVIYTPCQYMYHLAQWYIGLASFYEEDESYRFWWRKLYRTLPWSPQRGREGWRHGMFVSQAAIWGLHFVVFVIRVVEQPCAALVRMWRRRKLTSRGQPDDAARIVEDGIQLER